MPDVPDSQRSPFEGNEASPQHIKTRESEQLRLHRQATSTAEPYPHLTTKELAARWRMTVFSVSGKYRSLGLRPIRVGKRLLFPLTQIEDVERRSMDAA